MNKVLVASSNKGKLAEFSRIFTTYNIDVIPQSEQGIGDADETGLSFVENAIIKARHACEHSGLPAIADDSGLEVPALDGAPGIYSARYAGLNATDADNNRKLLADMAELEGAQRRACFRCLLVFMRHAKDPTPIICEGSWWGEILHEPAGESGFGYDPLFFVPDMNCASAQLERDIKNQISHRGQALKQLIEKLQTIALP